MEGDRKRKERLVPLEEECVSLCFYITLCTNALYVVCIYAYLFHEFYFSMIHHRSGLNCQWPSFG